MWPLEAWWNGRAQYRECGDLIPSIYRGRILTLIAGSESEEECLGSSKWGADDDCYQIDLMLDSLLPDDADVKRYHDRLRRVARHLVRRHRATAERVATDLLKQGTLRSRQEATAPVCCQSTSDDSQAAKGDSVIGFRVLGPGQIDRTMKQCAKGQPRARST